MYLLIFPTIWFVDQLYHPSFRCCVGTCTILFIIHFLSHTYWLSSVCSLLQSRERKMMTPWPLETFPFHPHLLPFFLWACCMPALVATFSPGTWKAHPLHDSHMYPFFGQGCFLILPPLTPYYLFSFSLNITSWGELSLTCLTWLWIAHCTFLSPTLSLLYLILLE